MKNSSGILKSLLKKYIDRSITPEEMEVMLSITELYSPEEIDAMIDDIKPSIRYERYLRRGSRLSETGVDLRLPKSNKSGVNKGKTILISISVAAAVVCCFFIARLSMQQPKLMYSCGVTGNDIIPTGSYVAELTLNSGCTIFIDSNFSGPVAHEGNELITRLSSGTLIYQQVDQPVSADSAKHMYHTISTSLAQQYLVVLPDGTRVRLNAASSIRFPLRFSGGVRNVELQGEAFFELNQADHSPFIVHVPGLQAAISKGQLDVSTYFDHIRITPAVGVAEIKTVAGAGRVTTGEQALVSKQSAIKTISIRSADTVQAFSWRKVMRVYHSVSWKELLADISRSYDLEIVNYARIPEGYFSGSFCYNSSLKSILDMLQQHELNFKLEGNRMYF